MANVVIGKPIRPGEQWCVRPPGAPFDPGIWYAVSRVSGLRWRIRWDEDNRENPWGFVPVPKYDWVRTPVATFTFTGPDAKEKAEKLRDMWARL